MKKRYLAPKMDISNFDEVDIICESGDDEFGQGGGNHGEDEEEP